MALNSYATYLASLPSNWEKVELQEIGRIYSGSTPSRTNPDYWQGNIHWITPGELTDLKGKYITTTEETITEAGLMGSGAQLLPENSILVTTRATIGSVAIAGIPIATNQGFKSIALTRSSNVSFYYHILKYITPEFIRRASGSTFLEISGGEFAKVNVPFPPLPEQRRIAEVLDAADAAIRQTERVIAKLRQVKQGLLHDLLTRGLDVDGNLRDPVAHPEQFKDSALGRVPRAWTVRTTSEFCSSIADGTHNTPKPSEKGYPLITSKNLKDGRISWQDAYLISEEDYQAVIQRSWVEEGDILFSMIGTLGNVVMLRKEESDIATKNVGILRFGKDLALASWMLRVFQSDYIEKQINAALGGSTQKFIALGTLRSFLVPVPNQRDEMQAVSRILDAHDARIRAEEKGLAKRRQVKRGLMDDLLTGRVRVG